MKRKNIIIGLGLLVFGCFALGSCTKNEDNTIVPIGTEYYVDPYSLVIDDIFSAVPDSLKTRFLAEFGPIPDGFVPPKIEGSFKMSPKQRVASNMPGWPLQTVEPDMFMRFSGQHNALIKLDLIEATETLTDTVFVCGQGNEFAVYFIENKAYDIPMNATTYHVKMKRGVVMKGKMVADGIADFRFATIIMDIEDDSNGQIGQYDRGSYFIYKDGDGKAELHDW